MWREETPRQRETRLKRASGHKWGGLLSDFAVLQMKKRRCVDILMMLGGTD
jgi:hypothetical protein